MILTEVHMNKKSVVPYLFIFFNFSLVISLSILAKSQDNNSELGTVNFPVPCSTPAAAYMQRGVALLHHMMYMNAENSFRAAIEVDQDCALGYWGVAMTFIRPIWPDTPNSAKLHEGVKLLNKAKVLSKGDKRSLAYITATQAYFKNASTRSENQRLHSFDQGWSNVYKNFPQDLEATSFYALAHMSYHYSEISSTSSPKKSLKEIDWAGEIVERVLTEIPDHPGAHHYIIHAYDRDGVAERALEVARNYGKISPEIPHALHMPSHIFTRRGFWLESIAWNKRSAEAALNYPVNNTISGHYFHALDYLMYGYLQTAQDENAKEIYNKLIALDNKKIQIRGATAYTSAAVPARYYLERHQWEAAAKLKFFRENDFPWDRFLQFKSIKYFARALGAARSDDVKSAEGDLKKLRSIIDRIPSNNFGTYWQTQVNILYTAAKAWVAFKRGNESLALIEMERSVEIELSSYKHPVTPGTVLPAIELLGDMLLEMKRPQEALTAYLLSLEKTPNRFNSLFGAGRANELMGDKDKAMNYYQKIIETSGLTKSNRKSLQHVTKFLALHNDKDDFNRIKSSK